MPIGAGMTGKASTTLTVTGNLDSTNAPAAVAPTRGQCTLYDSLATRPVTVTAVMGAQALRLEWHV